MRKGFTLLELLIGVIILGIVLVGAGALFGGCGSDWTYSRQVEGKIATQPASRFGKINPGSEGGNQQKFSIKLHPAKADSKVVEVAGGPSGVVVECLSTRCAQVEPGECHRFQCKHLSRWGEPDVISCKHDKEIKCDGLEDPVKVPPPTPVGKDGKKADDFIPGT